MTAAIAVRAIVQPGPVDRNKIIGALCVYLLIACFCLSALIRPTAASEAEVTASLPASLVRFETLESKIAEVEATADQTDEAKAKLVELQESL